MCLQFTAIVQQGVEIFMKREGVNFGAYFGASAVATEAKYHTNERARSHTKNIQSQSRNS
jgi:hypothetical protein